MIGAWGCRGHLLGDGAHTASRPWVTSTRTSRFGAGYGDVILVTEGFELADRDVPVPRAITGGTGPCRAARGEQSQTLLGSTDELGVDLRIALDVQPR